MAEKLLRNSSGCKHDRSFDIEVGSDLAGCFKQAPQAGVRHSECR